MKFWDLTLMILIICMKKCKGKKSVNNTVGVIKWVIKLLNITKGKWLNNLKRNIDKNIEN